MIHTLFELRCSLYRKILFKNSNLPAFEKKKYKIQANPFKEQLPLCNLIFGSILVQLFPGLTVRATMHEQHIPINCEIFYIFWNALNLSPVFRIIFIQKICKCTRLLINGWKPFHNNSECNQNKELLYGQTASNKNVNTALHRNDLYIWLI